MTRRPPLILGIGNRYRRDDAVGPLAADRLAAQGFDAREHSGEGAGLIEAWSAAERVVVIDATQSGAEAGAEAGAIRRLDTAMETLPTGFFRASTHRFGLAEAVETARALGRLPGSLIVYGVEGADFGFGEAPTPAVAAALDELVRRVAAEVTASPP